MNKFYPAFLCLALALCSCTPDKPVIGISDEFIEPYSGELCAQRYIYSVESAGGEARPIVRTDDPEEIERIVAGLDGLIITGGQQSVDPALFDEEFIAGAPPCKLRDDFDSGLLRAARKKGIPVVGICRGVQIMNVTFGGSMIQSIPMQIGTGVKHNTADLREAPPMHHISILPDSRLSSILGATDIAVNSWHNQACKRVAEGFRVVATADDGVIEAIESEDGLMAGYQFHPELLTYHRISPFEKIFEDLVKRASASRKK